MDAKSFLKKFSTKKDALVAIEMILAEIEMPLSKEHYEQLRKDIEKFQDVDLAQQVLDFFNAQYGTNYVNAEKIKALIRQIPKANFDQFASIIIHKKETWGTDPKMQDYLRPATLFGSVNKFNIYLDDATNYWIKKAKHESQGKI